VFAHSIVETSKSCTVKRHPPLKCCGGSVCFVGGEEGERIEGRGRRGKKKHQEVTRLTSCFQEIRSRQVEVAAPDRKQGGEGRKRGLEGGTFGPRRGRRRQRPR